jgi:hypothetical protein
MDETAERCRDERTAGPSRGGAACAIRAVPGGARCGARREVPYSPWCQGRWRRGRSRHLLRRRQPHLRRATARRASCACGHAPAFTANATSMSGPGCPRGAAFASRTARARGRSATARDVPSRSTRAPSARRRPSSTPIPPAPGRPKARTGCGRSRCGSDDGRSPLAAGPLDWGMDLDLDLAMGMALDLGMGPAPEPGRGPDTTRRRGTEVPHRAAGCPARTARTPQSAESAVR